MGNAWGRGAGFEVMYYQFLGRRSVSYSLKEVNTGKWEQEVRLFRDVCCFCLCVKYAR